MKRFVPPLTNGPAPVPPESLRSRAGSALGWALFTRAGVLAAAGVLLFAGCSVREELTISGDGSGRAVLTVALHPIMIDYMNDLMSAMTGVEAEYPIFDLEQLQASFAGREGIVLERAERPARGRLEMEVSFARIDDVLAREGADDVLALERRGANRELTVRLDRQAVTRFLEFAPEESTSMAQFILPPSDGSVSREEFRDEMAWALEEYEEREVVEQVLENAMIEVHVRPQGRIVSQQGGRIEGDTVIFEMPVLTILTLNEERSYSLVFAP